MQVLKRSNRQKVTIDEKNDLLREGGEGRVFNIPQQPDLVAKIYKRPRERQAKVEAMLQNPADDSATPGHVSIAWPIDLLYSTDSNGAFVGFLMKRIGKAEPIHEFFRVSTRKEKHPHFNFKYLHTAAANLAGVFAALHGRGYIVGDVNESNILISDQALVTIVDTDSFQIQTLVPNVVYRCTVGRAEFTPPELQSLDFSKVDRKGYHDLFGMGVLIFQLLMLGHHPFDGSPTFYGDDWPIGKRIAEGNFPFGREQKPFKPGRGSPGLSILDPGIQSLFLRCFEDGKKDPSRRPSALEWQKTLNNAIKQLVVCNKVALHYFGNHLKSCPWCERAKNKSTPDPFLLDYEAQTPLPPIDDPISRRFKLDPFKLDPLPWKRPGHIDVSGTWKEINLAPTQIVFTFYGNGPTYRCSWSITTWAGQNRGENTAQVEGNTVKFGPWKSSMPAAQWNTLVSAFPLSELLRPWLPDGPPDPELPREFKIQNDGSLSARGQDVGWVTYAFVRV